VLLAGLPACSDYEVVKLEGEDVFYQLEAGEVDILLVVDNSCSMAPYQSELAENFDAFLTYFIEGDVEYQIGVVTTTVTDPVAYDACPQTTIDAIPAGGELMGGTILTPDTADGDQVFSDIVNVGTCGAGLEMGLESAHRALTEPLISSGNAGFIRHDAYLSVIFVSDEEDTSPLPVNDYINAFRDVKGQRAREVFNASGLVVADIADCGTAQVNSGAAEGSRYVDAIEQTGGVMGNICADDFGDIVTELSLASSRLTDTFTLSSIPDASSLQVIIDEEEHPCGTGEWELRYDREVDPIVAQIIFDRAQMPPPQSRITARYNQGSVISEADEDSQAFCVADGGTE